MTYCLFLVYSFVQMLDVMLSVVFSSSITNSNNHAINERANSSPNVTGNTIIYWTFYIIVHGLYIALGCVTY